MLTRHALENGRGMILMPKSGTYSKVLFWFHGLGDDCNGWGSLMPQLGLADTKFILPTAPERPISLNGGWAMNGWSDILGLDDTIEEDRVGFDESAKMVNKLIQKEMEKGIPSEKISLGGFSQGGALALHVSLRSDVKLNSCVALSTWLPFRADFPASLSENSKELPILQVHGKDDQVVAFPWGMGTNTLLKQMIPSTEFMAIDDMGHSSDPEEIDRVKLFLNTHLNK